jgi:molybdopterin converting factor small subunit
MKITIEILGLPALSQALGQRKTKLDVSGRTVTVRDVLDRMVERFGSSIREALEDPMGSLNPIIQIALNGKKFVPPDRLDTPLEEGDTLTFMLLMAGGSYS